MTAGTLDLPPGGRRYLSLSLPLLPTDRVERRMSPEARARPRVTVVARKGTLRLCALNAPAAGLGLAPGLPLADARARFPDLAVSEAGPEEDARLLARLADACERYTPLLSLDGPEGLLLDVTGCAHLFGGEEGLVRDLLRRVGGQGFSACAALASTAGAAFALARFSAKGARRPGAGVVVPEEEGLAPLLSPLPLAALGLAEETLGALARLGFGTVGDLLGRPRAPLAARFGAGLLARLDAALGTAPAAVDYRFPPPVFCAERNLFEPVEQVEDVLGLTVKLAASLAPALERHGVGARRLDLALFRVDGKVTRLTVGTGRPLRAPEAIRRLFAEKIAALTTLDPGFGFDLLRLAVRETAPMQERQSGFAADADGAEALDDLIDRLSIRFGARQVQVLAVEDSHWPDAASRAVPAQGVGAVALLAAAEADAAREALLQAAWAVPPRPAARSGGSFGPRTDLPSVADMGGIRAAPANADLSAVVVFMSGSGRGAASPPMRPSRGDPSPRMERLEASGEGGLPLSMAGARRPMAMDGMPPGGRPGMAPFASGAAEGASPSSSRPDPRPGALHDRAGAALSGGGREQPEMRRGRVGPPDLPPARPDLCGPDRPLRLFETPEPVEAVAEVPDGPPVHFRWRRRLHEVVGVEGPERIAAEWWRRGPDAPVAPTRDYFRVETREGHRFWLFRAGLYGRETQAPRWFIHGLFG